MALPAIATVPTTDTPDPDAAYAIQRRSTVQNVAFAASITPDPSQGEVINVGALTAGITVNNPSAANEVAGTQFILILTQDGTGSRTLTLGNKFKSSATITATANKKSVLRFVFDGTNWVESGVSLNL